MFLKGLVVALILAAIPSSTNYTLRSYDFGSGGSSSASSSYGLQGQAGGTAGNLTSANYILPTGVKAAANAPVPAAPTFINPSSNYYRLKLTINTTGMPTDAKYVIAISSDDFATTKYVQTDQTIGNSLGIANYQTYASWGGASGFWVLGLSGGTTYKVKVGALQGIKTASALGPVASAATSTASVSFLVTTSLTSTPPFSVTFTSLPAGSVVSGNATINASVTTNAENGGSIAIKGQNNGLNSTSKSYTIASATADLDSVASGYGGQISSISQSSGGPLVANSPFNVTSNNVGALASSFQKLADFGTAITSGSLQLTLKAKTNITVPASNDFADIITLAVAPLF